MQLIPIWTKKILGGLPSNWLFCGPCRRYHSELTPAEEMDSACGRILFVSGVQLSADKQFLLNINCILIENDPLFNVCRLENQMFRESKFITGGNILGSKVSGRVHHFGFKGVSFSCRHFSGGVSAYCEYFSLPLK